METCTNCGAQLRQGAKFCTTCGARQNPKTESGDGWAQQATQIVPTITPEEAPQEERRPASSDDPASRFISALESEVRPAPELLEESPKPEDETPAFSPPPHNTWTWGAPPPAEADSTAEPELLPDPEPTPSSWAAWGTTPQSSEPAESEATTGPSDNAGFTDGGTDEVDYLSGDENIEVSGPETPLLEEDVMAATPETPIVIDSRATVVPDSDGDSAGARTRALELLDDLRIAIRQIGSGDPDAGTAAMTLTEVSLQQQDFSDLRHAVNAAIENPRDISALTDLAARADRIEALLDDHARLTDAIERALNDLSGS